MKTRLLISLLLIFWGVSLSAQKEGGGVIKLSLKTVPELVINKVTFFDENGNNVIDGGENCYFQLIVKNVGKTTANSPTLETELLDAENKDIRFEKKTETEQIVPGQSLVINFPVSMTQKQSGAASFGFTIHYADKYKTEQFIQKIVASDLANAVKDREFSPVTTLTWTHPLGVYAKHESPLLKIKFCIKTDKPVSKVLIYVNNILQQTVTKFKAPTLEYNCNYLVEKELKLTKGQNVIELKGLSKGKTFTSEKRYITYQPAITEYRNALVIGNSDYTNSPLKNPANDAKDIAKALRHLNFDVIELINADKRTMRDSIREFRDRMKKDHGVGLFYYAGHGMQVKGENYLIPVNHEIEEELDVQDESIRVNSVLEYMQDAGTRMNIVILDACRDNPFARSMRSGSRGLATMYAEGGGSVIAYATAPGSTASDGEGNNGLYTQELLKAINTPGLEIGMVFRHVLANVQKISKGKQIPWTNSSIIGEFYFSK